MSFFKAFTNFFGGHSGNTAPHIEIGKDFYSNAVIVGDHVDSLAKSLRNMEVPLHTSIHEVIIPAIRENFESEGRPKWKPLADSTVIARGSAHPILIRTGKLFEAATDPSIWHVTPTSASVGVFPLLYGIFHTTGTQYGRRVMPARPFMSLTHEDRAAIATIFSAWIEEQIQEKGKFKKR
jgi:phage gpG-like protein